MGDVQELAERMQIADLVTRLFVSIDEQRWDDVAASLSPKVLIDASSYTGSRPSRTTPRKVVDLWRKGLAGLAATHHQIGNLLVDVEEDEAAAFCYGITTHYFPNPGGASVHAFVGTFDVHLSRHHQTWLIDALRFNLKYQDGNFLLAEIAKKSVKRS